MKKSTFCFCLMILFTGFSARSQDCSQFLLLQNNKTVEMTNYNKKGEPSGRGVYTVSNVTTAGGVTTGNINTETFDRKGKSVGKATAAIKCNGGDLMLDMKMMLSPQQSERFNGATVSVGGDNGLLDYPASMKAGDALKDGNLIMTINSGPMQQTMNMLIGNRKVEAQESVTTPAGTWNCFKITFTSKITMKSGPLPLPAMSVDETEWYAPGVGLIKTESKYGSTVVTSIK